MPPKRVEDQPVIHLPIEGPSTSTGLAQSLSDAPTSKKHRDTRATHGDRLRRYVEQKGKIPVTFRKKDGRPIGEFAAAFNTELGVAVKKFAPIQVQDWKKVIDEQKKPIFDRLESTFAVDFSNGPNSIKKQTDKLMGSRYRDIRAKIHKYYKTLTHLPREVRLKKMPHNYCDNEADWQYLCKLFESEGFKNRSKTNATNRSKMAYNHCGGSKSFVRYSYEDGDGSTQANRIEVFNKTHYNSKNGWISGSKAIYDKMLETLEEYRNIRVESDSSGDASQPRTDFEMAEKVCDEVLGTRSGYIRGLGSGPKPARSSSSDATSRRPSNAELRDELASTQTELESTRAALRRLEETMETERHAREVDRRILHETIEANHRMMQALERMCPGILQPMTQSSSSSAPPPPPL